MRLPYRPQGPRTYIFTHPVFTLSVFPVSLYLLEQHKIVNHFKIETNESSSPHLKVQTLPYHVNHNFISAHTCMESNYM